MSYLARFTKPLRNLARNLRQARRYEHLFSLSDAELTARGLDRERLVRGFIAGFAYG